MDAMSVHMGIPLLRAEQDADRPATAFLSYKLLGDEQDHEPAAVTDLTGANATEIDRTTCNNGGFTVSISVMGPDWDAVWQKALAGRTWLRGRAARELAEDQGLVVMGAGGAQDRTVYLETAYEYRAGFDARFAYVDGTAEIIPALDLAGTLNAMN
jgi:hypothetical protein